MAGDRRYLHDVQPEFEEARRGLGAQIVEVDVVDAGAPAGAHERQLDRFAGQAGENFAVQAARLLSVIATIEPFRDRVNRASR